MKFRGALAAAVLMAGGTLAQIACGSQPDSPIQRAERLTGNGEYDAALEIYRDLAAERPESATLSLRIGGVHLLQQSYAEAVRHFQSAIRLDERNAEAFVGLGVAYLHQGRYGPAHAALTEARRLRPQSQADLDRLLGWLEQRRKSPPGAHF